MGITLNQGRHGSIVERRLQRRDCLIPVAGEGDISGHAVRLIQCYDLLLLSGGVRWLLLIACLHGVKDADCQNFSQKDQFSNSFRIDPARKGTIHTLVGYHKIKA